MPSGHILAIYWPGRWAPSTALGTSRAASGAVAHLSGMTTFTDPIPGPFTGTVTGSHGTVTGSHGDIETSTERELGTVLTLSQLAAALGVGVQTLYDLRSQGRGPRGFRVGRELRFRVGEVEAWLCRLEEADAERHPEVRG